MTPREIYVEALLKITGPMAFYNDVTYPTERLRYELMEYSDATRQTREARIARKALKDATYARMNGSK